MIYFTNGCPVDNNYEVVSRPASLSAGCYIEYNNVQLN